MVICSTIIHDVYLTIIYVICLCRIRNVLSHSSITMIQCIWISLENSPDGIGTRWVVHWANENPLFESSDNKYCIWLDRHFFWSMPAWIDISPRFFAGTSICWHILGHLACISTTVSILGIGFLKSWLFWAKLDTKRIWLRSRVFSLRQLNMDSMLRIYPGEITRAPTLMGRELKPRSIFFFQLRVCASFHPVWSSFMSSRLLLRDRCSYPENAQVAMKLGSEDWCPQGDKWKVRTFGNDFCVWTKC